MGNRLIYNRISGIMKVKNKRIGTFKQFLKEQKKQELQEARMSLDIEWWDSCILEVMQSCKDSCNGVLNYENLVNYVKGKFSILGRPDPGIDEAFLLAHIKDLIFQLHGDTLVSDGMCNWEDTSEVQAKGLVVSELAKVILDKILATIKSPDDPIPGITSVSLTDKIPRTLVPMTEPAQEEDEEDCCDACDDLPFESRKTKPVMGFKEYSKALNETVAMIDCESQEECIQYVLNVIKKLVGSLDANEIADYSFQTACTEVKTQVVLGMVKNIVYDYINNQKGQVKIVGIGDPKDVRENLPEEVFEQGLDILCDDIADKILGRLAEENGVGYEKV